MEPGLEPCPFCGGAAQFHEEPVGQFVECTMCHASSVAMRAEKVDARPLLAEKWNARACTAPITVTRKMSEPFEIIEG